MGASLADTELAERFGVPVSTVGIIRAGLTEGIHWTREAGRIVLTELGAQRLEETLSSFQKKPGGGGPALGAAPAATPGTVTRLKVLRRCPNPTFVRVDTPDGPRDVRVRDNARITPGTLLEARRSADGTWECANARLSPPRPR